MFNQIKTSAKNKEVVTVLTRKFGLGAENVIAQIQRILEVRNILRVCYLEICIPCMPL